MKHARQYQRELEAARQEAEQKFITALYEEAFQHGVRRGKFERGMEIQEAEESAERLIREAG